MGGGGVYHGTWHTKDSFPTCVAHSVADKFGACGWASVPFCGLSVGLLGFCHDCGLSSPNKMAATVPLMDLLGSLAHYTVLCWSRRDTCDSVWEGTPGTCLPQAGLSSLWLPSFPAGSIPHALVFRTWRGRRGNGGQLPPTPAPPGPGSPCVIPGH